MYATIISLEKNFLLINLLTFVGSQMNKVHDAVVDLHGRSEFEELFYVTLLEKTTSGPVSLFLF